MWVVGYVDDDLTILCVAGWVVYKAKGSAGALISALQAGKENTQAHNKLYASYHALNYETEIIQRRHELEQVSRHRDT